MPREIQSKTFNVMFSDTSLGVQNDQEMFNRNYSWVMNPNTWNSDGSIKKSPTLENNSGSLISTPFMDWHYWPEKMWNIIIRELILDTEAVIQSQIRLTAMSLDGEILENVKRVIVKPPNNTAGFIFNVLPGTIHTSCKMQCYNKKQWIKVNSFYIEVRNNLMHWKQITNGNKEVIQEIYVLYSGIYEWLANISVDCSFKPTGCESVLFNCFPERWKDVE